MAALQHQIGDTQAMTKPDTDADELLSKQQFASFLGLNPWTIDRLRKTIPNFPEPIWVTDKSPRWKKSEVQAYLDSRQRGGVSPEYENRAKPRDRKTSSKSNRVR
jgi:predicted DNA-binding transcriptional regulator AlpA